MYGEGMSVKWQNSRRQLAQPGHRGLIRVHRPALHSTAQSGQWSEANSTAKSGMSGVSGAE